MADLREPHQARGRHLGRVGARGAGVAHLVDVALEDVPRHGQSGIGVEVEPDRPRRGRATSARPWQSGLWISRSGQKPRLIAPANVSGGAEASAA